MNNSNPKKTNLIARLSLVYFAAAWLFMTAAGLCQAQSPPTDLSPALQHIVKLSKGGMDDNFILTYITNSGPPIL